MGLFSSSLTAEMEQVLATCALEMELFTEIDSENTDFVVRQMLSEQIEAARRGSRPERTPRNPSSIQTLISSPSSWNDEMREMMSYWLREGASEPEIIDFLSLSDASRALLEAHHETMRLAAFSETKQLGCTDEQAARLMRKKLATFDYGPPDGEICEHRSLIAGLNDSSGLIGELSDLDPADCDLPWPLRKRVLMFFSENRLLLGGLLEDPTVYSSINAMVRKLISEGPMGFDRSCLDVGRRNT